jgi:hypothetical protein
MGRAKEIWSNVWPELHGSDWVWRFLMEFEEVTLEMVGSWQSIHRAEP